MIRTVEVIWKSNSTKYSSLSRMQFEYFLHPIVSHYKSNYYLVVLDEYLIRRSFKLNSINKIIVRVSSQKQIYSDVIRKRK